MRSAELAATLGYNEKTLTSAYVLIPVAYYLRRLGSPADFHAHPKYAKDRSRIRKWLVVALLKQVFSAKTDTLLAALRSAIQDAPLADGFPLQAMEATLRGHNKLLQFSVDELDLLLNVEYGRRETFSILAALYPSLNMQFAFHIDHVHPRSGFYVPKLRAAGVPEVKVQSYQGMYNQLPNLQLLEGVANVDKLAQPFEAWTAKMRSCHGENSTNDEWPLYTSQNAIPRLGDDLPSYSIVDFDLFFAARRKLLFERLQTALSLAEPELGTIGSAAKREVSV